MFSRMTLIAPLMIVAGALPACDTIHANGSTDPGFGEIARHNAALQIIDPDPLPPPAGAVPAGGHGAAAAAAVKRYRTDTVKPVEQMQTTVSEGGSSGNPR